MQFRITHERFPLPRAPSATDTFPIFILQFSKAPSPCRPIRGLPFSIMMTQTPTSTITYALEAFTWWCGDYECNCTQLLIRIFRSDPSRHQPWFQTSSATLWQSDMITGGDPPPIEDMAARACLLDLDPDAIGEAKRDLQPHEAACITLFLAHFDLETMAHTVQDRL